MDADVAYADSALDAWASWVRDWLEAWPSISIIGKLIEQGANGASQCGRAIETMPEHILETDRVICRLDPFEKRVIFVYYLTYADSEVKAAQCGCSRTTFWRRVTRAQKNVYRLLQVKQEVGTFAQVG
jgi:predicted DNA-binding protein (UPF0251 family)